MFDRDTWQNNPRNYAYELVEIGVTTWEQLAQQFMRDLNFDQVRSTLESLNLEPRAFCAHCEDVVNQEDVLEHMNDPFCPDCYNELFIDCRSCGESTSRDDLDEDGLCDDCFDRETGSCECGEALNKANECPTCSLDDEY